MAQLLTLTVPGLEVKSDWSAVHDWLLDSSAQITDVLATTMAGTLLIVHEGDAEVDAWLERISEAILARRLSATHRTDHPGQPHAMPRAGTNVKGRRRMGSVGPTWRPPTGRRRSANDAA
jgi:hypothetical protein